MKSTLVGYTGFVGGNLTSSALFQNLYNSRNIEQAFGIEHELVVYSGMASEKFLANADPLADFAKAEEAMQNIRKMNPKKLVLISTVDVYPVPVGVDEETVPAIENAPAYGKNRYLLETWVRDEYQDALIVRLPGLFGKGIKKNFIFDLLTIVPSMLTIAKYEELSHEPLVKNSYEPGKPGFYKLKQLSSVNKAELKEYFEKSKFNALSFTDSRSVFQFYNLANLWKDIQVSLKNNLSLVNLATEPVSAAEIYEFLLGQTFENHLAKEPALYEMKSKYASLWQGENGYIQNKEKVLEEIRVFVKEWSADNQ